MDNDFTSQPECGENITKPSTEEEFTFVYDLRGYQNKLVVNVKIPLKSVREFGYRLIKSHSIPFYLEEELIQSLEFFNQKKSKELWHSTLTRLFSNIKNLEEQDKLIQDWVKVLLKGKSKNECNGLQTSWANIYHSLIHSPSLEQLLQLEHSFAVAMKELSKQRDSQIENLHNRHVLEMEEIISYVGSTTNDNDVNALAIKQLEESQMLEMYWSKAITKLQETQKIEYKQWVQTVHEKIFIDSSIQSSSNIRRTSTESLNSFEMPVQSEIPLEIPMEESFTIYLGNQIKSMHNIRLVCQDVMDFCQCKTSFIGGNMVLQPQRLQTAMTLYSERLSALILLVDDRLNTRTGVKKKFHSVCCESSDFHFADIDKQLFVIEETLKSRPFNLLQQTSEQNKTKSSNLLQIGDFYITKHSNLSEVHTIFHLVCDESVISSSLNSRHPVMIGLRNILLVAARHSIENLIVPLLLAHEMGENFTVQWCLKRAELVFKCVKGFMMEGLSWDGQESKTIQFVVPPGISEELFLAFSSMLPSIFRVSTTLDLSNLASRPPI